MSSHNSKMKTNDACGPASTFITYFHMEISWNISPWSLLDIITVPGMVETHRLSFKRKKKESLMVHKNHLIYWGIEAARSLVVIKRVVKEGDVSRIRRPITQALSTGNNSCVCLRSKNSGKKNRSVPRKIRKWNLGGWEGLPGYYYWP